MVSKISSSVKISAAMMMAGLILAIFFKPTHYLADSKPALVLSELIPTDLPGWQEFKNFTVAVPDPTIREVLDATYSQTLTRGYINKNGNLILLTLAYGRDQNSEATAAHRPEFCYVSGGFNITELGIKKLMLGTNDLDVRHMIAKRENYQEKISYWITLDETTTLPGFGRKLAQIQYGLSGRIADGMLVRVSSPYLNDEKTDALELHKSFLNELSNNIPDPFRSRFFGS